MFGNRTKHDGDATGPSATLIIDRPEPGDGTAMWRIARDSRVLDLNSSYAYLLWARDFAGTSVVARSGDDVVGFVSGYLRPDAPGTLFVWQVAVDASHRGKGVALTMLRELVDRAHARGARLLETTITSDNEPSIRLFTSLAREAGVALERGPLFTGELFPDAHEAEDLYRLGPWPS
ncbi:L-2,4-diaminobutyric acid acetyltransferase [Lentzea fradiae]|uniref:L-2,4-diaminobutyric acid acetyltransferase n=1 Tax=Lentzea fradiae TaxID=200378 RepID=A0A1G7W1A8_9PSEU|nr:diaminobutyrate acetyltransferase [Lentzea fradiae]SDG65805.1 L-2,4-diaminobutyric acid acetyltransferase [Lentzea fradiae]